MGYFAEYFDAYFGEGTAPVVVATEPSTGGWVRKYDKYLARLIKQRMRLEEDGDVVEAALEAAGVALPVTVTDAPPDDLPRLRRLVVAYARKADAAPKTQRAIDYAKRAQSQLAYELAIRAIAKEIEDEDDAIATLLAFL